MNRRLKLQPCTFIFIVLKLRDVAWSWSRVVVILTMASWSDVDFEALSLNRVVIFELDHFTLLIVDSCCSHVIWLEAQFLLIWPRVHALVVKEFVG